VASPAERPSTLPKTTFASLPGEILDLMGDYFEDDFPQFAFVNKSTLDNYLVYQRENLEV